MVEKGSNDPESYGKEGKGEDRSCKGGCSIDHWEGSDGGMGDDNIHEKGDKHWKMVNKSQMERELIQRGL